jgi:SAM-dependent methyltransferase
MTNRYPGEIAGFIAGARASIVARHPGLRELFETYANEAEFGLSIIEEDVGNLPEGSAILEIGAGILLLSGYLASRGFRVCALEPIEAGFSHFRELQDAVRRHYESLRLSLAVVVSTIEDYADEERFDYAFSINVFEHIHDVERGLSSAYGALKTGGTLRVYCPNYRFPYEPHFNIPTLGSKRLTEALFNSSIMGSAQVLDPRKTWEGLNWINVARVKRVFRARFGVMPAFNRLATYGIVARTLSDRRFNERRSPWISVVLRAIDRLGLMRLFMFFPVGFAPVMDFRVRRGGSVP